MGSVLATIAGVIAWIAALMGLETAAVRARREKIAQRRLATARLEFIGEYEFPASITRVAKSFAEQDMLEREETHSQSAPVTVESLEAGLRKFLSDLDPAMPEIPIDKRVDALFRVFINEDRLAYIKFCDEAYGVIVEYPKQARAAIAATMTEAQTAGLNKTGWTSSPFPTPRTNKNARVLADD